MSKSDIKMMYDDPKVAVCIPTAGMVSAWFMQSVIGLMAHSGVSLSVLISQSSVIHMNRETLVETALALNPTHILFLDDDMVFPPQILQMMLDKHEPIVGCNYIMRQLPAVFTARVGPHLLTTVPQSEGIEEVDRIGFGCCLIEARVFEDLKKPMFLPRYEDGAYTTEDEAFFRGVQEAGYKVYVDQDASKLIAHQGSFDYSWKHFKG